MGDIIKFMAKRPRKAEPPKQYRFTICWSNVCYIERQQDGGCRIFFVGGNSIIVDRRYEECDKIAKDEWSKK